MRSRAQSPDQRVSFSLAQPILDRLNVSDTMIAAKVGVGASSISSWRRKGELPRPVFLAIQTLERRPDRLQHDAPAPPPEPAAAEAEEETGGFIVRSKSANDLALMTLLCERFGATIEPI